jgi:acetylornithine deacetylase
MALNPIALTKQLVDIESTTYYEGACGEFLVEFLAGEQWAVERQPVRQPELARTPGAGDGPRFNVYASMKGVANRDPDVVFSTHFDTVPPFLGPCREDDEFLYGRGVCDAKGILAAQVAAAERLREGGERESAWVEVSDQRRADG